jgi:hypothetical protein
LEIVRGKGAFHRRLRELRGRWVLHCPGASWCFYFLRFGVLSEAVLKIEKVKGENKIMEPIKIDLKLCWWCTHFYMQNAETDWSDVTPGSDFGIKCYKNKWQFDAFEDDSDKLAQCILMAPNCADFVDRTKEENK